MPQELSQYYRLLPEICSKYFVDGIVYPTFKKSGYEIGSGPTEAFCKMLTLRLKGPGMRWDKVNAEAVMTLASLRASGLWDEYWKTQQKQTA
jgi:hypothetical protein